MGAKTRIGAIALGLASIAAAAQSPHRLVVVVGHPDDPRVKRQHAELERDADAMHGRDVTVQDIAPEDARRERPEWGVGSRVMFEVLLVGKDGGIKLRREQPIAASEIEALIDTMPMRRYEMRR